MEKFEISVAGNNELFDFQVVNNGADQCEYEVFAGNELVAVFEPDETNISTFAVTRAGWTRKLSFRSPTASRHIICSIS